ncbi:hypothetical protein [Nocardia sp. NPDC059228]|uniref:hypothetical protein n=1 Tax=Nocardia sp. NPDC059228 TaxID=3346777 RepID=UPI003691F2F4
MVDRDAAGQRAQGDTPAHQYPTGGPPHPERRAAVLDWIRASGAVLLEDDYDGEFRYDRQPVGALRGLDPDRIAYLGSVSKSLSPALRLGWMALPDSLIDNVLSAKGSREMWVSGIAAGLHAVLELPDGTEDSTLHAARRRGLALDGLRRYRHPAASMPHRDGLVIGYGTPSDHGFGPALEALCQTDRGRTTSATASACSAEVAPGC